MNKLAYSWMGGQSQFSFDGGTVIGAVRTTQEITSSGILFFPDGGFDPIWIELESGISNDDHNVPGLCWLGESKFLAGVTQHNESNSIKIFLIEFVQSSFKLFLLSEIEFENLVTYTHILRVSADDQKLLLVTRGIGWKPTALWITLEGKTIGEPFVLFPWEYEEEFRSGKDADRPYVKFRQVADGCYFMITDSHPRAYRNGLYGGKIADGAIWDLNQRKICAIGKGEWSPSVELTTLVTPGQDSIPWVQDLVTTKNGDIYFAFSTVDKDEESFKSSLEEKRIGMYHVGKWSKDLGKFELIWSKCSGHSIYSEESDYLGGISLNPENPSHFAFSERMKDESGELNENGNWIINDVILNGESCFEREIFISEDTDFIRPIFSERLNTHRTHYLFCLKGNYDSFTDFSTELVKKSYTPDESCFSFDTFHVDLPYSLKSDSSLPDDLKSVLKGFLQECNSYFEIGAGASTLIAMNANVRNITTLDTDLPLLNILKSISPRYQTSMLEFNAIHIQVEKVSDWGYPTSKSDWQRTGELFVRAILEHGSAELTLIDGRFRVASFFAVLESSSKARVVLFDDYLDRSHYWVVESVLCPMKVIGRMAVFYVPENLEVKKDIWRDYINDPR
jgi:hypothetical protein